MQPLWPETRITCGGAPCSGDSAGRATTSGRAHRSGKGGCRATTSAAIRAPLAVKQIENST